MRGLTFQDVYSMSRIMKKMQLKDSLDVEGKTQSQAGAELILSVGENLYLAENEVNNFLGDLVGMSGEEFAKLPITDGLKYYEEFKTLPGIESFFKSASRLMK